jgi:WD40 repeat protein
MRKRFFVSLLTLVVLLLVVLSGVFIFRASFTGRNLATPTPTRPFTETTPLVIHPPLFAVNIITWSTDGKRLVVANGDGIYQVWNTASGQLLSTHVSPQRSLYIAVLAWSADGQRILSTILGPRTTIDVWSAATGKTLATFSHSSPVAASQDGQYVAVGTGGKVQIWDAAAGKQLLTFDTQTDSVMRLDWSPDGRLLAATTEKQTAGGATDSTVQVWQAATGQFLSTDRSPSSSLIDHLAWSPDSRRIVSVTGAGFGSHPIIAQVWDAASGTLLFTTPDEHVTSVAWSPDSKQLAVAGQQMQMQTLDAATGRTVLTYADAVDQNMVSWSPDGASLASTDATGTTIWKASADQRVTAIAARHQIERSVTWSPDGKHVAAEGGGTFDPGVWKSTTGENLGYFAFYHEFFAIAFYNTITAVAWSPDGLHLAMSRFDRFVTPAQVIVWGNQPMPCGPDACFVSGGSQSGMITALAWSPDSTRIASASSDKSVLVYDVAHQKSLLLYRGHTGAVFAVAWSPDGKYLASAGADKSIQVWDTATGARRLTLQGHTGPVTALAWSPDSKRLVSASEDSTVRIWDAASGDLLLTYRGHSDTIWGVSWSPDSKRVASCGEDGTIQVW